MGSRYVWIVVCLAAGLAPASGQLTTGDIPRFYTALDALASATTHADSVATVKRYYLDGGSEGLRLFAKARDLTPERILAVVRAYPRYYASIREDALAIDRNADSIAAVLAELRAVLPDFEVPPVTIAFGVLNTGGTTRRGHVLLGAGMIAAGEGADRSELPDYLRPLTSGGGLGDIATLAAHEAVHTWQRDWPLGGLARATLREGVPDFVVYDLLGRTADDRYHVYGAGHECAVWEDFADDLAAGGRDAQSRWLYNAHLATPERPADLGYFVGRRVAAAYYDAAEDKEAALKDLRRVRSYPRVVRRSGYAGGCNE